MKYISFKGDDGSIWGFPISLVYHSHASYYKKDYNDDFNRCLTEDTNVLFEDRAELLDWVTNNMDWDEVKDHVVLLELAPTVDLKAVWDNVASCNNFDVVEPKVS